MIRACVAHAVRLFTLFDSVSANASSHVLIERHPFLAWRVMGCRSDAPPSPPLLLLLSLQSDLTRRLVFALSWSRLAWRSERNLVFLCFCPFWSLGIHLIRIRVLYLSSLESKRSMATNLSSNGSASKVTASSSSNPPTLSTQTSFGSSGDGYSQRRSGGSGSFGAGAATRTSGPAPRNKQTSRSQHKGSRRYRFTDEDAIAESVSHQSAF